MSGTQARKLHEDQRKASSLECAARLQDDEPAYQAYLKHIMEMNARYADITSVYVRGLRDNVFIRLDTSDLMNLRQVFFSKKYGFPFTDDPERIMDLGAYAGFSAVYLANRFPDVSAHPRCWSGLVGRHRRSA